MGNLSDKIKIIYLTFVILFALGVFAYLLDTWGVIRLQDHLPFLRRTAPEVSIGHDSLTELERERQRIELERLREEEIRLKELEEEVRIAREELAQREEELDAIREGLEEEKKQIEEQRVAESERQKMIANMANRVSGMPPADAVAIVAGWSNSDLVDVFLQMERNAEEEGQPSIVPFLITQLPRDRAAVITTLMMDQEARLLPE